MPRVKTPVLLQLEAVECGAACLGIILEYYGRVVPLTELRVECGVSRDGVKAANMLKAARHYGLAAKGFRDTLNGAIAREFPYIAFWNFNHFLVVEGVDRKRNRVYLNDPAHGHRTVSVEEFDTSLTGVVLVFTPTAEFVRGGSRPGMLKAIAARLRNAKATLLYLLLAGLVLAFPALLLPTFSQVFLDRIIGEGRTDWLRPLLVAMALAVAFTVVMEWVKYLVLRRLAFYLKVTMSGAFVWHLLRLPVRFYTQRYSGEIAMRQELNESISDTLSGRLADTCLNIFLMIFYAALMLYYSVVLTLVGVGASAVSFLALRAMNQRRRDANMRVRQDYGKAAGTTVAALQSMETIKAAGQESAFFAKWAGRYAKAVNTLQELQVSTQTLTVLPVMFQALTIALIYFLGGQAVINGDMSVGALVALTMLMHGFQRPVAGLVDLGARIQELDGNLKRLDDVLAAPLDPVAAGAEQQADAPDTWPLQLEGRVELRNVTFGYSPLESPLFDDLSIDIKPGSQVAFVGGSGSGKTTLTALICGLYPPWDGRILFDGQERSAIPRAVLTSSFSLVSQDIFLFEGTVRENLTLWNKTIPDETLIRALEDAAVLDVVLALPGGLDSVLLEGGANLSGGQRQRLEIARALVQNPTILVLDEATSALDTETESVIMERLRLRGCTCILVAHRLSTIRDSDEIIVLRDGKIVESGTHADLWNDRGLYAELLRADEGVEGSAA